jgi:hypothetical protein
LVVAAGAGASAGAGEEGVITIFVGALLVTPVPDGAFALFEGFSAPLELLAAASVLALGGRRFSFSRSSHSFSLSELTSGAGAGAGAADLDDEEAGELAAAAINEPASDELAAGAGAAAFTSGSGAGGFAPARAAPAARFSSSGCAGGCATAGRENLRGSIVMDFVWLLVL